MIKKWRWAILGGGLRLYILGLGFLDGIAAEQVRFDQPRMVVLKPYDEAIRQWQSYFTQVERRVQAG